MIFAFALCPRSISTQAASFSSLILPVRLKIIVPACSIWLMKNSPKFFIYILHFKASTTATALFNPTSASVTTSCTAFMTSESFPTPEGSIKIRSGSYVSSTSFKDAPKSPTKEQQIQPEFISLTSIPDSPIPASFRKPPSIPISPNSFSINTTFVPASASFNSFLINVVLPAPRNPDTISIFVIANYSFPQYYSALNVFCSCFRFMSR